MCCWTTRRVAVDLVTEAAKKNGEILTAIHHWVDGILTGSWYLLPDLGLLRMDSRDGQLVLHLAGSGLRAASDGTSGHKQTPSR